MFTIDVERPMDSRIDKHYCQLLWIVMSRGGERSRIDSRRRLPPIHFPRYTRSLNQFQLPPNHSAQVPYSQALCPTWSRQSLGRSFRTLATSLETAVTMPDRRATTATTCTALLPRWRRLCASSPPVQEFNFFTSCLLLRVSCCVFSRASTSA